MSDLTTDLPVETTAEAAPKRKQDIRTEFMVYFAIIFVATLPLAFLTWGLSALRRFELPAKGPVKSAWSQAQIITPRIFSA